MCGLRRLLVWECVLAVEEQVGVLGSEVDHRSPGAGGSDEAGGSEHGEVLFAFDHRVRAHLETREGATEAPELAPGNARVFRIGTVIVSCLSPGAGAMTTQAHNLIYLGCKRFVIVGAAGSICPDVQPGATVVATAAIRDDGISQHYLPPGRSVEASPALTQELQRRLPNAISARTWTMPIPYRLTAAELDAYAKEGIITVEMEAAPLFAVARALDAQAGAVLIITDLTTLDEREQNWAASTEPLRRVLEAVVHAL